MSAADLIGYVDALAGSELEIHAAIQSTDDPDLDGLVIEADVDDTAGEMALVQTLEPQVAGMLVYVSGVEVDPEKILGKSVTRSINSQMQRWSFSMVLDDVLGEWGVNPVTHRAPSLCLRDVDIFGAYLTSTGLHLVPLIAGGSGGVVDNEERIDGPEGPVVKFVGVDAGGRYDGETVNAVFPPGHGHTRARVARLIAERAGFQDISLEDSGRPMMKEFQAADAQPFPLIQDLADVETRRVMLDRQNTLVWRRAGAPDSSEPVLWNFTERNFKRSSLRITQPGDVITQVDVSGEAQVPAGAIADVTTRRIVRVYSLQAPHSPAYLQNADGSFTANPPLDDPDEPILIRLEWHDRTLRGSVLIYERSQVWEYFNPQVDRYEWDATNDEWDPLGSVYTEENSHLDGAAYRYSVAKWLQVADDEKWHPWYKESYQGSDIGVPQAADSGILGLNTLERPDGWDGLANPPEGVEGFDGDWGGVKIGSFSRSRRWYAVKKAQRTRGTYTTDWNTVEPAGLFRVLGNKHACTDGGEEFIVVSEGLNKNEVNSGKYLTGTTSRRYGWNLREGLSLYIYGDNAEYVEDEEVFRYTGSDEEDFVATSESSHDYALTVYDLDDQETEGGREEEGIDSYLPAAECIPDEGPPEAADDLAQAEIDEAYERALRTEALSIAVTCHDEELEDCHPPRVVELQAPYAENEEDLEAMGWAVIDLSAAAQFDGELAGANFFVEAGDVGTLTYNRLAGSAAHPIRVEEVSWSQVRNGPIGTQIAGRFHAG